MRGPIDRMTENLPRPWRIAIDWIVTIVGAVVIVLLIKAFVVNPYRIPSSSMEPTLHCARPGLDCEASYSDRVLANRFIYHFTDPARKDIVVFHTPKSAQEQCGAGGTFVKRIIGLAGETVTVRDNGKVIINGKPLDESGYIKNDRLGGESGTWHVPKHHIFVMGDNRKQSCDSRVWGALDENELIGKVFAIYWPPKRIGFP
jgi:signal peptidase I